MMSDENFKEYLDEELGRIFPEQQKKYRELFEKLGFNHANNDFTEFWSVYSDEIYGKIGYLIDLAMDLEDFPSSQTQILREGVGLPEQYVSLLNNELDDYIFYDKNTDKVFFVESMNINKFLETGYFDQEWEKFCDFIRYFLDYPVTE